MRFCKPIFLMTLLWVLSSSAVAVGVGPRPIPPPWYGHGGHVGHHYDVPCHDGACSADCGCDHGCWLPLLLGDIKIGIHNLHQLVFCAPLCGGSGCGSGCGGSCDSSCGDSCVSASGGCGGSEIGPPSFYDSPLDIHGTPEIHRVPTEAVDPPPAAMGTPDGGTIEIVPRPWPREFQDGTPSVSSPISFMDRQRRAYTRRLMRRSGSAISGSNSLDEPIVVDGSRRVRQGDDGRRRHGAIPASATESTNEPQKILAIVSDTND